MAVQYQNNFEAAVGGAFTDAAWALICNATSNWQITVNDPISGIKTLQDTAFANGHHAFYKGAGVVADQCVQFSQIIRKSAGSNYSVYDAIIRTNAPANTTNDVTTLNGYIVDLDIVNNVANLYKVVGGALTKINGLGNDVGGATGTMPAWANGNKVNVKLEASGTHIRARAWLWGTPEPSTWNVETIDATYASGYVGARCAKAGTGGPSTPALDDFFVGDAGTIFSGYNMSPDVAALPTQANGTVTVHLVGVGTAWTGGTVFTVSGVTGITKASQSVTDGTHAIVTLNMPNIGSPATPGLLTIDDGSGTNYATIPVGTATISVSPSSVLAGATVTLTITGVNTAWKHMDAAPTFTVPGLGGSITAVNLVTDTQATVSYTAPATQPAGGTTTLTGTGTGATATLTITVALPSVPVAAYDPAYPLTISFGPVTGGTFALGGVALYRSSAPGGETYAGLPLETYPGGALGGSFTVPATPMGLTYHYTLRSYDANLNYSAPSNEVAIAPPAVATAVVITGPTEGVAGEASAPFTIAINGTGGPYPITLPAGFSPGSVSVAYLAPATATYTPPSTGLKTLTATPPGGSGLTAGSAQFAAVSAAPGSYLQTFAVPYGLPYNGLSLGYQIVDKAGAILVPHTPGGLTEVIAGSGLYGAEVLLDSAWSGFFVPDAPVSLTATMTPFDAPTRGLPNVTVGAFAADLADSEGTLLVSLQASGLDSVVFPSALALHVKAGATLLEIIALLFAEKYNKNDEAVNTDLTTTRHIFNRAAPAALLSSQDIDDSGPTVTKGQSVHP